ncbi:MAG: hypothetical protein ACFFDF_24635, partial [Candidatus Odinarchaeota archaeon]
MISNKNNPESNQESFDSIEKEVKNLEPKRNQFIFSRSNIKSFIYTMLILFGIIGAYYLIMSLVMPMHGPMTGFPPPGASQPFPFGGKGISIWPFWGTFSLPTLSELLLFTIIILVFVIIIHYYYKSKPRNLNIYTIVFFGTLLIIFTNLISGWDSGIVSAIGGEGEIFADAVQIVNPITFINKFEALQDSLSVHARTHPPGAVLIIYFLYILFNSPGIIAIAICVISSLLSAYFLNGILKRFFKGEIPKYVVFLYLLLPAVQVYYLANIYGIVSTLIIGVIYFYLHDKKIISIIGSIICVFLATFISFMALFIVGCLCLYEILNLKRIGSFKRDTFLTRDGIKGILRDSQRLLTIIVGIIGIYGVLLFALGFNYINSFLTAMATEATQGWKLISNPLEYFTTRIKNIMDILMFFGPILIVLFFKGFKTLKKQKLLNDTSAQLYHLVSAAILTLLIIFALGAYDHGETARAAIFIYPFLLIPVTIYINNYNGRISRSEMRLLLFMVFGQAIF